MHRFRYQRALELPARKATHPSELLDRLLEPDWQIPETTASSVSSCVAAVTKG